MPADSSSGGRRSAPPEMAATVLLIEDEPGMRRVLARALARKYKVVEAENGRRGLEAFLRHRPDLVITDMVMPDKGGVETIREIHEMAPGTKIIAISGGDFDGSPTLRDFARAVGIDAILAKPFPLEHLMSEVEKLLRPTLH
jgi:CheY-like chemotaxis protein